MAQETWMKVVKAAPHYRGEGKCLGWILGIARNTCLSELRHLSTVEKVEEAAESEGAQEFSREDFHQQLEQQQRVDQLKTLIDALPDSQRAALLMWVVDDLSYDQIARELDLSISAVKSQLFRARQNLEKAMKATI